MNWICTIICFLVLVGLVITLWRVEVCVCKRTHLRINLKLGSNQSNGQKCIDCYGIPDFNQRLQCLDTCVDPSPCLKCQRQCFDKYPKIGDDLDKCLDVCGGKYDNCY